MTHEKYNKLMNYFRLRKFTIETDESETQNNLKKTHNNCRKSDINTIELKYMRFDKRISTML